jgi:hypothetical protein
MSDTSLPQGRSVYKEVSVLAAGTEFVAGPCTIWDITVTLESNNNAVVSFSDSDTAYDSSTRFRKVVLDGPGTHSICFPKGHYCSDGLCVTSNVASVDVGVSYD